MKFTVGHVAYRVFDMKRALEFYVDKLGLEHAFTIYKEGTREPSIEYIKVSDGQFIELFYTDKELPSQGNTYHHLCLNVEDHEETVRYLLERGVEIVSPPKLGRDNNWQFWIADPEGNRIELMEISPRSPHMDSRIKIVY